MTATLERLWERVCKAHARTDRYRAADDPRYRRALESFEAAFARSQLAELKAEMVRAHPDKGGSSEAFIRARARYLRAKQRGAV